MAEPFDQPFRLRVMEAVTAALRTIVPDAGDPAVTYSFDLSEAVFRGRTLFGDSDPLPLVSVLEFPQQDDGDAKSQDSTTGAYAWRLLVQGWVEDDPENPSDPAYAVLADVRQRLLAEKERYGEHNDKAPFDMGRGYSEVNLITQIEVDFGAVRPPDGMESDKVNFWLPVTLWVVEDGARPYA